MRALKGLAKIVISRSENHHLVTHCSFLKCYAILTIFRNLKHAATRTISQGSLRESKFTNSSASSVISNRLNSSQGACTYRHCVLRHQARHPEQISHTLLLVHDYSFHRWILFLGKWKQETQNMVIVLKKPKIVIVSKRANQQLDLLGFLIQQTTNNVGCHLTQASVSSSMQLQGERLLIVVRSPLRSVWQKKEANFRFRSKGRWSALPPLTMCCGEDIHIVCRQKPWYRYLDDPAIVTWAK